MYTWSQKSTKCSKSRDLGIAIQIFCNEMSSTSFPKNTTQCPQPELKPLRLDPAPYIFFRPPCFSPTRIRVEIIFKRKWESMIFSQNSCPIYFSMHSFSFNFLCCIYRHNNRLNNNSRKMDAMNYCCCLKSNQHLRENDQSSV